MATTTLTTTPLYNGNNILSAYTPPFTLLSDMLVGIAFIPTLPLHRTFPNTPFLSITGHTPLAFWVSAVHQIDYHHNTQPDQLGGKTINLYDEVTFVLPLRRKAFFVPDIYANDALTVEIGHEYGMPKQLNAITFTHGMMQFEVWGKDTMAGTHFRATPITESQLLKRIVKWLFPLKVWPVIFPDGRYVRPTLTAARSVTVVRFQERQLAVRAEWLPDPITILSFGFWVPGQEMVMPPPPQ